MPVAAADVDAGGLRLPDVQRQAARPGSHTCEAGEAVEKALEAILGGDLSRLEGMLGGQARDCLHRLSRRKGPDALSIVLRVRGRSVCHHLVERVIALPDGLVECRLRLFRLLPGGHIRSCLWVAQARPVHRGWRIIAFDRLPCAQDEHDPEGIL